MMKTEQNDPHLDFQVKELQEEIKDKQEKTEEKL